MVCRLGGYWGGLNYSKCKCVLCLQEPEDGVSLQGARSHPSRLNCRKL